MTIKQKEMENNIRNTEREVSFFAWAAKNGENLYNGTCFEEHVYLSLIELENEDDKNQTLTLLEKIGKNDKRHPQDEINDIFQNEVKMDYSFAEKISRHDVLEPECFYSETENGKALLFLLKRMDLNFIVSIKSWTKEGLHFDLEACNNEFKYPTLAKMVSGEYSLQ